MAKRQRLAFPGAPEPLRPAHRPRLFPSLLAILPPSVLRPGSLHLPIPRPHVPVSLSRDSSATNSPAKRLVVTKASNRPYAALSVRPGVSERPPDGSAGPAALAGLAGSAAAMVAAALAHTLAPSVPFPPLAIAQAVVRAAPGGLATSLIDVLGHWALRLAVLGTLLAFLASGPVLGLLI